jgi:hypothetical protein
MAALEHQRDLQRQLFGALQRFAETGVGDVKKLKGIFPPEYRLKVGGWRILFRT